MIITKTVTFSLPDEHEEEKMFREEHKDWTVTESTGMITYTKTIFYYKEIKNDNQ